MVKLYQAQEAVTILFLRQRLKCRTNLQVLDVDVFDFDNKKAITNVIEFRVSAYISCVYNTFWWIGLILEVDVELGDVKIDFLHLHGLRKTFTWPVGGDTCHVPMKNILCSISAPLTATGRTYNILDVDYQNTVSAFEKHKTK